jgi:hypothetical protein
MFERIWSVIALGLRAVQLTAEESELKEQKLKLQQGRPVIPAESATYELAPVRLYELSRR